MASDGKGAEPPPCLDMLNLVAWERQTGFATVARQLLHQITGCLATGRCALPAVCSCLRGEQAAARVYVLPAPRRAPPPRQRAMPATVQALDLSQGIEIIRDEHGNWMEMRTIAVDRLQGSQDGFGRLFDYWRTLAGNGQARLADVDPMQFTRIGLLGWIHLVNAESDDPAQYHFDIRATRMPPLPGTCMEGIPFRRHRVPMFVRGTGFAYRAVLDTGVPRYDHVRCELLGETREYRRLMLPLASGAHRRDRLIVAVDLVRYRGPAQGNGEIASA